MQVIALLYHDVVEDGRFASSGFPGGDADIYKLSREDFEEHLDAIGRRVAPARPEVVTELRQASAGGRSLLLTFDDGGASAYHCIAGLLERRGWRGHFLVTTDYIDRPGFLTRGEIRELAERGHVIGSHSRSHPPRMSRCSDAQLWAEWRESVECLSGILGRPVVVASVPGGYYSRRVAETAGAAGIRFLFNSEPVATPGLVGSCLVLGRYSLQWGHSPQTAAALAAGEWPARTRQFAYWNAKKLLKLAGGRGWLALRKLVLSIRRPA